jgi:serine protease Do
MTKDKKSNNFAVILLASLISGLFGGAIMMWLLMSFGMMNFDGTTTIKYDEGSRVAAWEEAAPAVVSIVALKDLSEFYNQFSFYGMEVPSGDGLSEVSSGTGFIITPDGLLVTNKHVVEDETAEYVAVLSDGTELTAEILDKDPLNDIALMQLSGDEDLIGALPILEFADSDGISVGEPVLAIGNALGEYSNTTTAGIISATGRSILAAGVSGGAESLVDLIQTDAAINPGNSGGPLVDMNGDVVGMNTAVDTSAAGIGFAIPANDVSMVIASYQEFGEIIRPFLGVRYVMVNAGIVTRMELSVDYGAFVTGDKQAGLSATVEGSAADKAGLKDGDVILTLNGRELNDNYTLSNAIAGYFVGETVVLEVLRNERTITLELVLEARED